MAQEPMKTVFLDDVCSVCQYHSHYSPRLQLFMIHKCVTT